MTGIELKNLMNSNEIFIGDKNTSIVLLDDNGVPYNVPKEYKRIDCAWFESLRIVLFYTKDRNELHIDFIFCGSNLFSSYKLSELTTLKLIEEFDKFLSYDTKYKKWRTRELRDNLISNII